MPNEDTFNPEEFKQFVVRNKSAAKTAYTVKKSLSYTEQLYERDRVIGEEMRTSPNPIVRGLTKATDYILPQALSQKDYGKDEYNIYGDIGARIPGAGRALIQNKNPIQGFKKPSTIPTMGEYLYLKQDIPLTGNTMQDALRAYPTAFVGEAIDMALNPFTWVGGSVANNKTLATGAQKVGKLISENPITKTTAQLLPRMANNALGITRNTGKNLNVAERGLRNVRLTFGSPMRQFRKFQAKMVYTEDDLRNLPLKQQVVRQAEKATIKYRGEGGQLSSQIGAKAEDIAQAKSKGEAYRDLGQIIKQNIAAKRQGITAKHQSDTLLQKINNREAKLVITDNINMLDDELTKVAHQGAEDIQPLLKQFFKGNSEAYGDRLNKYSDLLEKSGKPLTIGEANGIADNILKELDEMEILGGNGRAMVQNLKAKYSLTNVEGVVIRDANDTVNFIEFNKGMRDIIHTTSATFKSGARVTENDLVQVMVHKHWGNYIAQNVEDFSDMQGAYRPVIEAMKTTGKVFKPYASGFQNTGGAAFLRKVATGASTPQETRALKLVEEGKEKRFSRPPDRSILPSFSAAVVPTVNRLTQDLVFDSGLPSISC